MGRALGTNKIRLNQVYKCKDHSYYVVIFRKKGGKWKVKVLSDKPNVFRGTHTLAERTIQKCYELVS